MPDRVVIHYYYYFNYKASHLTKAFESCSGSYCAELGQWWADARPWRNAHCSRWDSEEQTSPELSGPVKGSVLDGWMQGRISSYPSGEIWWKKIVTFQFLQLVWISINALYFFFPPIPSMEFPQTIKFESRFHSTKSLYVITFKEWWGTQFKTL